MRFVDSPSIAPAACICGKNTTDSGPYLDTEITTKIGRFYLCRFCFLDAVAAGRQDGGLVSLAVHEAVVKEQRAAIERVTTLEEQLHETRVANDKLTAQVAELSDEVTSLNVISGLQAQKIRELQSDPVVRARQSLFDQVNRVSPLAAAAGAESTNDPTLERSAA